MKSWKHWRTALLIVASGGVFLTLGKTVLFPAQAPELTPLTFPAMLPLFEWQFLFSQSLRNDNSDRPFLSGQQYHYQKEDVSLSIEMRYLAATDGDVYSFIQSHSILPSDSTFNPTIHQQSETGFYMMFADANQSYLSSCINPYGKATVTDRQFKDNLNFYDISHRLLPWLLGEELKDERCLWVVASISGKYLTPNEAFQHLEMLWTSSYPDWRSYLSHQN